MTAMIPDIDPEEMRDIIHGAYVIVYLTQASYKGDLEGFNTVLANVKHYIDGDATQPDMYSWRIVYNAYERGDDPTLNAVAYLGDACAYAQEGSTVAIECAIEAMRCAIRAGVQFKTIKYLDDFRSAIMRQAYKQFRADLSSDSTKIDYDAIDADVDTRAIFRPGFSHRWGTFSQLLRVADTQVP